MAVDSKEYWRKREEDNLKKNLKAEDEYVKTIHGYYDYMMDQVLNDRTLSEFERQAGILGKTIKDNAQAAHAIVNASFSNARFSDRIWMYQDMLKAELSKLLQEGLIQGRNPRQLARHLEKLFGASKSDAERLMRTELARVQTEAQKQSFEQNGFKQYEFIALGSACEICKELDGKHFDVEKMMSGENAPPMHPNCRCSVAAWVDDEEYEGWIDYLGKGGTTEEWERLKNHEKSSIIEPEDKGDLYTSLDQISDDLEERSLQVSNFLNTLGLPDSKWSGITKVVDRNKMPGASGKTKSNGDIWLRKGAGTKTVIHEHLHTRSVLHNKAAYRKYKWFEENACEMLAEELCDKYGIKYTRTYKNVTDPLRDIAMVTSQYVSDYDFALDYFNAGIENREKWLIKLANKETDLSARDRILNLIEEIRNA